MAEKYCIAIPAVLDEKCISSSIDSYIENIFNYNSNDDIRFIIHIDNYQYEGDCGTLNSIVLLYEKLKDAKQKGLLDI